MAEEKLVTVTVKKDDTVADGKGGYFAKGDKIEVSKDTAEALKARDYA